ncbi:hypothetical protein [Spirillospora sp. CA-128828]|uniref:hypothetical protein n=1 Tax=Spirillospora sp. CA-128828 TaxID=3240033 RepID=UPI003D9267ED
MKRNRLRKHVARMFRGAPERPATDSGDEEGVFPNTVKLTSVDLAQLLKDGTLGLN